jgi:DNA polymerase elongation subunit (family B)
MKYKKSKIKSIEVVDYNDDVYDITLKNKKLPYFYANNILTHNSSYPHALLMGNLYSGTENEGWNGGGYFNIKGNYNNKEQGKIELALKDILLERLKAKKAGDKVKSNAYKIVINGTYGLTGNAVFKSLYNPITASDCTSMGRTWLKKLAKTLEENGFEVLYGFTDNVILLIPEQSNKEELMYVVKKFIEEVKSHVPFPMESFNLELETEMKFIWFVAKIVIYMLQTKTRLNINQLY